MSPQVKPGAPFQNLRSRLTACVEAFLSELKNQPVLYYPNPGNAGDSLIAASTYQALKRAGVPYYIVAEDTDLTNQILIIGGGGNLVPIYNELRTFILDKHVLARVKRLIILPHTIRGNEDLLEKMDHKVTIFCREPDTYAHVSHYAATPHVYLGHDMSFHFDMEIFLSETANYSDVPSLFLEQIMIFDPESALISLNLPPPQNNFFRTDGESLMERDSQKNLDIAKIFELGVLPENSAKATMCFFEAIKRSATVRTDRLHVALACALLNKTCKLYDNSYGKNSSIFEHSIRKFSPHVELVKDQ